MRWVTQFLNDPSGNASIMRLLTSFVVIDVMVTWTVVCIESGTLVDIGTNNLGLVGAAILGKAVQRGKE